MKKTKILAMLLCIAIIVSSMPIITINATENDFKIITATDIMYGYGIFTELETTLVEDPSGSYVHCVASPGTYTNNDLYVMITFEDFAVHDYPYIVYGYRTDSQKNTVDVGQINSTGENWMNSNPTQKNDASWSQNIININDINGNTAAGLPSSDEYGVHFRLKPWGSHNKTLGSEQYFDIRYVAAFKTEAEAKSFKFDPKNDYGTKFNADYLDNIPFYETDESEIQSYLDKAYALIDEIMASPTDVEYSGIAYYISYKGDDSNDGLTPETAWKSAKKVSGADFLKEGDAVFFERGGTYRYTGTLSTCTGVTYSAFGSGSKPKMVGSIDASDEADWVETEYENLWAYTGDIGGATSDVGQIVFDMGDAWGIKLINKDAYVGTNSNGLEMINTDRVDTSDLANIKHDLEYFHSWDDETLYLYSKDGNPATRFLSIEIVDKGNGYSIGGNGITIDNIEFFGFGAHGIGSGTCEGLTVQNCVFSFIGGSRQYTEPDQYTRYGNAVEIYGGAKDFTIHNCYAHNIYDCCWTAQYQSNSYGQDITFENVEFYNNVACYSNTGLEVWLNNKAEYNNSKATYSMKDLHLHDNYTFFNGYGWSQQRPNKDGNIFYGDPSITTTTYENCSVDHNIGIFASKWINYVRYTGTEHYNFNNNIYFQHDNKLFGGVASNPEKGTGNVGQFGYDKTTMSKLLRTGFEPGSVFYHIDEYTIPEYSPEPIKFNDVSSNHWAYNTISSVVMRGFMSGISADEFSPDSTMTRAMFVTLLSRLNSDQIDTKIAPFTDVSKNAWYTSAVNYAYTVGLVDEDVTEFRPDEAITREELADMLYRYLDNRYMTGKQGDGTLTFTDASEVKNEYAAALAFATENGIITGYPDGTVKPNGTATRAEVATMIKRFVNLSKTLESDYSKVSTKTDYHVLTAKELSSKISTLGGSKKYDSESDKLVILPENPDTALAKTPRVTIYERLLGFELGDYPYVKIKLNISGKRNSFGVGLNKNSIESRITPAAVGNEWNESIFCTYDMIKPGDAYLGNSLDGKLFLEFWSEGDPAVYNRDESQIEYIAFFPTKSAAESFEYGINA